MSFSIATIGAVAGATNLARQVATGIGRSMGFDEVLRAGESNPDPQSGEQSVSQLSATIRQVLAEHRIAGIGSLRVSIQNDARITVEGDHPHAANIEAILNADSRIVDAASRHFQSHGATLMSVDLTQAAGDGNIRLFSDGEGPNV